MQAKKLRLNRYDYAAFFAMICYATCSMIVPMCLYKLAIDLNMPLDEGGQGPGGALQIGRSAAMLCSMIFCGIVAGKIGKAKSLGLGALIMGCGILLCSLSPAYICVFVSLVAAGLGEGFLEGLASPFVQDQHVDDEPSRYMNFFHAFWSVGIVATVLVAGYLIMKDVHWRTLIFFAGVASLVSSATFFLPDKKKLLKEGTENRKKARSVARETFDIVRRRRFLVYFAAIFLAGGGEFGLTFWVPSFIKLCRPGSTMLSAGIATACFAGGMIIGRMGSGIFAGEKSLFRLLVFTGIGATAVSVFFTLVNSMTGLCILLVLTGIFTGPFWPSIQSYAVMRLSELDSTMIFVILSCSGIPGCGIATFIMGCLGDRFGLDKAFMLVPACFLAMTLILLLDKAYDLKKSPSHAENV